MAGKKLKQTDAIVILPIALLVGAAVTILVISLLLGARDTDARALAEQRTMLGHALQQFGRSLARELKIQTVWADAYNNVEAANTDWMHEFYGTYLDRLLGYKRLYVLSRDNAPVYAYGNGAHVEAGEFLSVQSDIADMIAAVRDPAGEHKDYPLAKTLVPFADGTSIEHFALADTRLVAGQPSVVVISTIVPDSLPPEQISGPAPLMVAIAPLDAQFLAQLGAQFDFADLEWSDASHSADDDHANFRVSSLAGQHVGDLHWGRKEPGAPFLRTMGQGLGVSLVLLVALAHMLMRRGLEQARLIDANSEELARLNSSLEQRVLERTRQLEGTLENISQGILMLSSSDEVLVSNARAFDLLEAKDHKSFEATLSNVLAVHRERCSAPVNNENRARAPRCDCQLESGRILEVARASLPSGDQVITLADVTLLKRRQAELEAATEAATAASRAKTQFLSTMSHEMRTPLNGVVGALDLLNRTSLDANQKHLVETAMLSGEALLVHINDVLDFSKMEAGKLDLEPAPFDVHHLIGAVMRIVEPQAAARKTEVSQHIEASVPRLLTADVARVRQILLNLAGNATKFTAAGSVSIRVSRAGGSDEKPEIEFSVTDTGPGIPANRISSLFQEFSMLDASYARQAGGTGLGLAICKRLVAAMQGTIGVESEEGKGSRFWFRLPLGAGAQPESQRTNVPEAAGALPVTSGIKVLLVDDSSVNRMIGTQMLTSMGHTCDTASNGLEAVNLACETLYDVILMDISMPELDGIEATRRIRSLGTPHSAVPIIALTANAIAGDRERFLDAGMSGYLTKPYRRGDLEAALASVASPTLAAA